MNIIPFPNSNEKIYLTEEEIEEFNDFMAKLKNSSVPDEAIYYKNKLESIITIAKKRKP